MASSGIVVSVCGRTHTGKVRKENQDSLLMTDLASGEGSSEPVADIGPVTFPLGSKGAILLVADGMGGRAGGAKASSLAVASVRAAMANGDGAGANPFPMRLTRALVMANEEIHEESRRDDNLRGMGTTATLAGLHGGEAYFAQVGDSRAYLVRGPRIARVTRDQSLVQDLIDSGVVSESEARNVKDNRILQALGTGPSVMPALTWHDLKRGDLILLCSDGLSRVVEDEEIRRVVGRAEDCLTMCERLIAMANSRGGPDNITVLVARVDGEGLGSGGDAPQLRPWSAQGT